MRKIPFALLFLVLGALTCTVRGAPLQSSPDVVKDLLWWFPEDTETLLVARGPFTVEAIDQDAPPKDLAQFLHLITLGPIISLHEGKVYNQIQGQSVLLVVEGSRKFRPPTGLGGMLYQGCHAIVFDQGFASVKDSLLKSLRAHAKENQYVLGQQVMRFEEKLEDDHWKFYVTFPQDNLMLCATDEGFLTETLSRMKNRRARRALPPELPEWDYVDTEAAFWGLRHYSRNDFAGDPSSPLSGKRSSYNIPDKEAIGLVYSFATGGRNELRVKYLSINKEAFSLASKYWDIDDGDLKPRVDSSKSGVDIIFNTDNLASYSMLQWLLLGAFGHGVYV